MKIIITDWQEINRELVSTWKIFTWYVIWELLYYKLVANIININWVLEEVWSYSFIDWKIYYNWLENEELYKNEIDDAIHKHMKKMVSDGYKKPSYIQKRIKHLISN